MSTQPYITNILGVLATSALLVICGQVSAQTIIPLHQQRSVNTFLIVPQCLDKTFEEDSAEGFEPLDSVLETLIGCDSGFGFGFASQFSQIGDSSLTGFGDGMSEAGGPVQSIIHAFGYSYFEVTFELPSLSNFELTGLMTAGTLPDGNVGAGVLARLWEGPIGGVLLFQQSLDAPHGGGVNEQTLEASGTLEPGVYTFDIQAGSFIDNEVPPTRSGQASFDFTFDVSIVGDIDEDGTVGTSDLLILLASWGPCIHCNDCPADINNSCDVEVHDLLILLDNWG